MTLILSGSNGVSDVDGTAATPALRGSDSNTGLFFPAADAVGASVGGVEGLRLTSTGLGIGTSSPGVKLDVVGNIRATRTTQDTQIIAANTGGVMLIAKDSSTGSSFGSAYSSNIYSDGAYPMLFWTNGTERMRLDSSGNLGLGVTPSAWGIKAMQFGSVGAVASAGAISSFSSNTYWTGSGSYTGQTYIGNGAASAYLQNSGTHAWYTAPSGTAGNAITFTQAMTLTAAGDLGLGATSVSSALSGDSKTLGICDVETTNVASVRLGSGSSFSSGNRMEVFASASTVGLYGETNAPMLFYTNATERARIDSSGNFILASANDARIYSQGVYNVTTSSAANIFVGSDGGFLRSTSSIKYKRDVQEATHGLAEVMTLRPVTYKGNNDGETIFGGLIAEEVHEAGLTEFVQYAEDGTPDALAYGNMVSLCIKAIQELNAKLEAQAAEIAALKGTA